METEEMFDCRVYCLSILLSDKGLEEKLELLDRPLGDVIKESRKVKQDVIRRVWGTE